jgi:hypothetical protein
MFENNFWNYLNENGIGKGLNGACAKSGPWPRPFGCGGLQNGGPLEGESGAERVPSHDHRAPWTRGGATGAGSPAASSGQGFCVERRCG